ncbi:hypothetical protein FRC05_008074 [Tulasnella sp. 425]|nr:hypothetical protein FRC05_008074 [Tulasnella sp. 425]
MDDFDAATTTKTTTTTTTSRTTSLNTSTGTTTTTKTSTTSTGTSTTSAPAGTGVEIRTVQDPVYHLYLQNDGGTAVIGPESSGGLFTINGSIKLNGPNLYLNIANSTTSYHALTFDSTATFTGWALEGDTIITAQSSQYGRQLNFLACPTSKTSEWQLYLQLGIKDYNDTSPTVSRNAGLTSLNVVIDPVEIVTVAEREFAESVVAVSVHMRNLPERWWGLLESTKLPLRMFVPSLDNRGFFQPCMLGDLTTLEELEIGDTYAYPVLLYLAAPINSEMPCPQLRKLTLIVDVRWGLGELVAKLLRARKISCRELTVYDGDDQVVKLESGSFRSQ